MVLDVPYISQWDPEANAAVDDCGPTCLTMILRFLGIQASVNDVFKVSGAGPNSLESVTQIQQDAAAYGLTLEYHTDGSLRMLQDSIAAGKPVIALIHYDSLSREDSFTGGHFVLVVGADDQTVTINDPDYYAGRRNEGDHKTYSASDFTKAWGNATLDGNPSFACLIPSRGGGDMLTPDQVHKLCWDAFFRPGTADDIARYTTWPAGKVIEDIDASDEHKRVADAYTIELPKLRVQVADIPNQIDAAVKAATAPLQTQIDNLTNAPKPAPDVQVQTVTLKVTDLSKAPALDLFKELLSRLFPPKGGDGN